MPIIDDGPVLQDGEPPYVGAATVPVAPTRFERLWQSVPNRPGRHGARFALAAMIIIAIGLAYRSALAPETADPLDPSTASEAAQPIGETAGSTSADNGRSRRSFGSTGLATTGNGGGGSARAQVPVPVPHDGDRLLVVGQTEDDGGRSHTTTASTVPIAGTSRSVPPRSEPSRSTTTARSTQATTSTTRATTSTTRATTTTTQAPTTTTTTAPLDGPKAISDSASAEESAITVDVLANDRPGDGALVASTLRITSGPSHARSASVTSNYRIRYVPREHEGTDQLTYQICDVNSLCDTATLQIQVDD